MMSRMLEQQWQLGALAFDADLIDSVQLSQALSIWSTQPERSLVEVLIEQKSLTHGDVTLLEALWEKNSTATGLGSATLATVGATTSIGDLNCAEHATKSGSAEHIYEHNRAEQPIQDSLVSTVLLEVTQPLAQGGIGKVDIALDATLNRRVAMKRIQPKYATDLKARLRFAQEAEITSELEHPAIVPIYHYGVSEDGEPFYSMRLIEGRTLREIVDSDKKSGFGVSPTSTDTIEFRRLLSSFITVCRAVQQAHSKQIIHRDLKPSNVIIGDQGETMLVDWGLAKRLERSEKRELTTQPAKNTLEFITQDGELQLTMDGTSVGTPAYMSPEQASGIEEVTQASDIFGLGATLYFLLIGQAPYRGNNAQEILAQAKSCAWQSFSSDTYIPPALAAICSKAMSKLPRDRYDSADHLADDIERWLADAPISIWKDGLATRTRRWINNHRAAAMGLFVSAVATSVGVLAFSIYTSAVNAELSRTNAQELQARNLAQSQSELALSSLKSVTLDIQRKLKFVPAAQQVQRSLLETAVDGLSKVSSSLQQRDEVELTLVIAHRELGDLFFEVGDIGARNGVESAKREFELAEQIANVLVERNPADDEAQRQRVLCMHRQASLRVAEGHTSEAARIYQDTIEKLEVLHSKSPHNDLLFRALAVAHNLLGDLENKRGNSEEAGSHFMEAYRIQKDRWDRKVQHEDLERDRIVSSNKVGSYLLRTREYSEAEKYFQQSLIVSRDRCERLPNDFQALRDLSTVYYWLGKVLQASGRIDEALVNFQAAIEIDRKRFELDSTNSTAGRDYVQSCNELAEAFKQTGNSSQVQHYLESAIDVGEQVIKHNMTDKGIMRDVAYSYSDLGDLRKLHEPELALQNYEDCLRLMQRHKNLDPENSRSKSDVAFGLNKLASGLANLSRYDEANSNYIEAVELQRQRLQNNPADPNVQESMVETLNSLVQNLLSTGSLDRALTYGQELVETSQKLSIQAPQLRAAHSSAVRALVQLGRVYRAMGDSSKAKQQFTSAQELLEKLIAEGRIDLDGSLKSEIRDELEAVAN